MYTPGLERSFSLELTDTDVLVTDLVFNRSQTFAGPETYAVAVADFNGDNLDDLVYTTVGDNKVKVLINQTEEGSATLSFASRVYATGDFPQSVAVGDFDGDGDLDFVVGNTDDNTVSVYFNDGSGSFPRQISADSLLAAPLDVQAADIDKDGKDDIVIANFGTSRTSLSSSATRAPTPALACSWPGTAV